jgi:hypothetical protein
MTAVAPSQGTSSVLVPGEQPLVGPFLEQRPVEPLHLAVDLGSSRRDPHVSGPGGAQHLLERGAVDVREVVVGHHPLDAPRQDDRARETSEEAVEIVDDLQTS